VLWEFFHWFTSLAEVIAVVAAILALGLIIAKAAFWVLSRSLGRLASTPAEPDPDEYETDISLSAAAVPTPPNDPSLPPSLEFEHSKHTATNGGLTG
jgi:hypothetical protein